MRRPSRRYLLIAGIAALALLMATVLPSVVIQLTTRDHRFPGDGDVPQRAVALVLGAGVSADGTPSALLQQRIDVAVRLYREGRVKALLMSGDHGKVGYDEVEGMFRAARAGGVPATAIVLDHAGFDTFSSCYRARSVFGVRSAVVVTQGWHLARAVWLCRGQGIDAVGAATVAPLTSDEAPFVVREFVADIKAVANRVTARTPRFPGPQEHSLDAVNATGP